MEMDREKVGEWPVYGMNCYSGGGGRRRDWIIEENEQWACMHAWDEVRYCTLQGLNSGRWRINASILCMGMNGERRKKRHMRRQRDAHV